MGATFQAGMVIWGTLLQRRVPPALLGRMSSLDFFVSLCFMPVSMALAGPVSELIGLTATFLIAASSRPCWPFSRSCRTAARRRARPPARTCPAEPAQAAEPDGEARLDPV